MIVTMMKTYAYICLLSALSIVEMKIMRINEPVGKNVTISCSDWNSFSDLKDNVKYLCKSPCTYDKHIIIKAQYKKTKRKDRIELTNSSEGLFVTFINLQKSDSGKYYCGVERLLKDAFIEVNVIVTGADPASPKTTLKTVTVTATTGPTMSSVGSAIFTDMSLSNTTLSTTTPTASATQGAGSVPYLIIGVIVIITALMVLLTLMRNMKRKQKVVSRARMPQEHALEDVEYDEIRHGDQQSVRQHERFSTLDFPADPDSIYANCSYNQDTELEAQRDKKYSKDISLNPASSSGVNSRGACSESTVTDLQCDVVYSVAQLPKRQIQPTGQSKANQSESIEDDSFYSLLGM